MSDENKTSSEVEEKNLAQEALEATEGVAAPAGEPAVPLHKHVALRERAQRAEIAQARAEGELAAIRQQQSEAAPAEKSPLQVEMERQAAAGIDEDDMTITPKVYRAQKEYEERQATQKVQQEATEKLRKQQLASVIQARAAHDDFDEVIKAGDALLTKGEVLDLNEAGVDFGERTYAKCKAAIEAQTAAKAKSESKTETAPENKPSESEAEKLSIESLGESIHGSTLEA